MFYTKKEKEKQNQTIANLRHEIEDLKHIIKTQELMRLRTENERLSEKEKLISKVKFRLKDVAYLNEENVILVKYEVPFVKVFLDEDGKPKKNDMFYAINKLQLISLDDMKKISKVVESQQKQKQ